MTDSRNEFETAGTAQPGGSRTARLPTDEREAAEALSWRTPTSSRSTPSMRCGLSTKRWPGFRSSPPPSLRRALRQRILAAMPSDNIQASAPGVREKASTSGRRWRSAAAATAVLAVGLGECLVSGCRCDPRPNSLHEGATGLRGA